MQFFKKANLNIVGVRKYAYMFSGTLILLSLVSLILHKGPQYGIDFTGGTSLQVEFEKTMHPGDLRESNVQYG